MHQHEHKPDDDHAADCEGREIDGTVLHQFAPDRPIQKLGGGNRGRRRGHSIRLHIHRATPSWFSRGELSRAPLPKEAELEPMTATNKSAMLGVRTSPSVTSLLRSTPSNKKMLRPKTWRW